MMMVMSVMTQTLTSKNVGLMPCGVRLRASSIAAVAAEVEVEDASRLMLEADVTTTSTSTTTTTINNETKIVRCFMMRPLVDVTDRR